MASTSNQTASPETPEHVAERALGLYRAAQRENERLRRKLTAAEATRRKAVDQARKAIPMLRRSQAKLKAALAANSSLEEQLAEARAAASAAERQAHAALAHARKADERAARAEAQAKAADGKAAIEGRLQRLRAPRRTRAA